MLYVDFISFVQDCSADIHTSHSYTDTVHSPPTFCFSLHPPHLKTSNSHSPYSRSHFHSSTYTYRLHTNHHYPPPPPSSFTSSLSSTLTACAMTKLSFNMNNLKLIPEKGDALCGLYFLRSRL